MRHWLIIILLFVAPIIAVAQDDIDIAGWTVEEHCISEVSVPPEAWTFEGVIYTWSTDAVRGFRSDFPVSYIIAFGYANFLSAGAFSPDGNWFAVPAGRIENGGNFIKIGLSL